jgi:hypothetical protein
MGGPLHGIDSMKISISRIAGAMLVLAVSVGPVFLVPARAGARDAWGAETVVDGYMVSGEPGEDPHLKVNPDLIPVKESEQSIGAGSIPAGRHGDISYVETCGCGGKGIWNGGSRVNQLWRTLLQTLFWQLHR